MIPSKNSLALIKKNVSTSTTSSSSFSYSSSGYGGYNNWDNFGSNMKPTPAFKAHGIEFWGSARANLHDVEDLNKNDLIVNCSGIEFKVVPFIRMAPSWLDLPGREVSGIEAQQIVLDWKDMSPPPIAIDLKFWEDIVTQARNNGIKRIFACCGAGQGRTGTALSAFLLATGVMDEPDYAVDYIRDRYSDHAVETQGQEIYLFNLVYDIERLFEDASDDDEDNFSNSSRF